MPRKSNDSRLRPRHPGRPGRPKLFTPGQMLQLPAPHSNLQLLIVGPDLQDGLFGRFSSGNWQVRCHCGKTYIAHTRDFTRSTFRSLSCGCLGRQRRKSHEPRARMLTARPPANLASRIGQTFGRLEILSWIIREGWKVRCECGAVETVGNSQHMAIAGLKPCPHKPQPKQPKLGR